MMFMLCIVSPMGIAYGQQYDINQGYIFDQKYVQRIDLAKGDELIGEAGGIEKFRKYDTYKWEVHGDRAMPAGVNRNGDRLVFKFPSRPELSLRDFEVKSTDDREGDSQRFIYLHSFANYHLVGIPFGHDEPGFLLIEKSGAKIYFVDHP